MSHQVKGEASLAIVGGAGLLFVAAAVMAFAMGDSTRGFAPEPTFQFPPSTAECAESWNAEDNLPSRREVAAEDFGLAVVDGWQAKGVFGYCSVYFLRGEEGGPWVYYLNWVSGYEADHSEPPGWLVNNRGQDWGEDNPEPFLPKPNASVDRSGSVQLLDGA